MKIEYKVSHKDVRTYDIDNISNSNFYEILLISWLFCWKTKKKKKNVFKGTWNFLVTMYIII